MLAYGGKETELNENMKKTEMSDGTIITFRQVSSSDKTPVVQINIDFSSDPGEVKRQKIHFMKEDFNEKNRR